MQYKKIIPIILILVSIGVYFILQKNTDLLPPEDIGLEPPFLTIDGRVVELEIADTPEKRNQGLSDKPELCENCGMLFLFDDKVVQNFWMKDMNFPLDIIWISDNKIVNISRNLPPEGERPTQIYSSGEPVNRVLEVNAGFTQKYNIIKGSQIIYNLE